MKHFRLPRRLQLKAPTWRNRDYTVKTSSILPRLIASNPAPAAYLPSSTAKYQHRRSARVNPGTACLKNPPPGTRVLKEVLSTPTALANHSRQTLVFAIQHLQVLLAVSVPPLATPHAEDDDYKADAKSFSKTTTEPRQAIWIRSTRLPLGNTGIYR